MAVVDGLVRSPARPSILCLPAYEVFWACAPNDGHDLVVDSQSLSLCSPENEASGRDLDVEYSNGGNDTDPVDLVVAAMITDAGTARKRRQLGTRIRLERESQSSP